jgi:cytochrome c-type biogenesis protein CcmH
MVTAEAKESFDRALKLDPQAFKARYFLGLSAEQDGRREDAAKIWRALIEGAPPGAQWLGFVRESLMRVDPSAASAISPGPSAADVAAANEMSPEQRNDMVRGMVARLAERLKQEGSDIDGWARLLRAYMVLGEPDKARAAAGDARRALAGEPEKIRQIDELIKGLGLEG